MKKVILDTDPGIDDAMALLFLRKAHSLEIVGVTTCFGNAPIDVTTRNTLYLCELFDIQAPVAKGAAASLEGETRLAPAFVHGDNALGDVPLRGSPKRTASDLSADAFIIEMAHRYPHQITVIAISRLTNLALALRRDPSIVGLLKEIIVMGGAFGFHGHSGNVTPVAEANIGGDPLAADEVLGADWPVTLVGLDVTQQTIMPTAMIEKIGASGGAAGKFIQDIARFYIGFHRETENIDGMFIHDSSAVAYLLDPSIFVTRRGPVRVVCDGIAAGQTIQHPDVRKNTPRAWRGRPSQTICTDVRPERILDLYYRTIVGG